MSLPGKSTPIVVEPLRLPGPLRRPQPEPERGPQGPEPQKEPPHRAPSPREPAPA